MRYFTSYHPKTCPHDIVIEHKDVHTAIESYYYLRKDECFVKAFRCDEGEQHPLLSFDVYLTTRQLFRYGDVVYDWMNLFHMRLPTDGIEEPSFFNTVVGYFPHSQKGDVVLLERIMDHGMTGRVLYRSGSLHFEKPSDAMLAKMLLKDITC